MSPEEWLSALKKGYELNRDYVALQESIFGRERHPLLDGVDIAAVAGSRDAAEDHYSWLRERLSDELLKEIDSLGRLAVGELHFANVNASVIACPAGGWVIALRKGLSVLLYAVARLALATTSLNGAPPATPRAEGARAFREMISAYHEVGVPITQDAAITLEGMQVASLTASAAERFVLCHELAHVLLGHASTSSLRAMPDDVVGDAREATKSIDEEFAADCGRGCHCHQIAADYHCGRNCCRGNNAHPHHFQRHP